MTYHILFLCNESSPVSGELGDDSRKIGRAGVTKLKKDEVELFSKNRIKG